MKSIVTIWDADGNKRVVYIGMGKGQVRGERSSSKVYKPLNPKNKPKTS